MSNKLIYSAPNMSNDSYTGYNNRTDEGSPITTWNPPIVIQFNTFITDAVYRPMIEWCYAECNGKFFSPKVWWFMFELSDDFIRFRNKFNMTMPILYNEITRNDDYDKMFKVSANIDDEVIIWCSEYIKYAWGVASFDLQFRMGHRLHNQVFFFDDAADAVAFKLRWG